MRLFSDFSDWLDKHLAENLSNDIVAVNFNLYEGLEGSNSVYFIELIGCDKFEEGTDDWACDGIFSTDNDIFIISKSEDIIHWEQGMSFISGLIKRYLIEGTYANKLKNYIAIGVGFVDGNIDIIHHAE